MIPIKLRQFLAPPLTKRYLLRLLAVAVATFLVFRFLLQPVWIHGASMEPTYRDGSFVLCWRLAYLQHPPQPGDIVTVRLAGNSIMYLKRVVATAGDTVEFRHGVLYRNNQPVTEPYVHYPCAWDLPLRTVKPGHIYVVGDNRDMPLETHRFGQTTTRRIAGAPLW